MERALKERIIGAMVLVVLAVLVVPVFLDGPSDDADIVRESIALPGQTGETAQARKMVVLNRDREQPVPVEQAPTRKMPQAEVAVEERRPEPQSEASLQTAKSAPPTPEPEPSRPTPATSTPVAEQPSANGDSGAGGPEPAASTTGMWAVQLGSFTSRERAERLAASLRESGYAAFLSQQQIGDANWHRVRVGPQKDRAAAEAVAKELAGAGHQGQVRPHP